MREREFYMKNYRMWNPEHLQKHCLITAFLYPMKELEDSKQVYYSDKERDRTFALTSDDEEIGSC